DKQIVVADVIDNDSWRIWPKGDKSQMLDKQIYRDASEMTDEARDILKRNYAQVAEMTGRFLP
ncbi:MAG: phosphoribosylaminoimidazolesuccinocarboxamide synthase, partial [Patescibacteria group bacterium]